MILTDKELEELRKDLKGESYIRTHIAYSGKFVLNLLDTIDALKTENRELAKSAADWQDMAEENLRERNEP